MRARYVIVIFTITILVVGARLFLFPPETQALPSVAGLDIQQMHKDMNVQKLPVQEMHDMSLVFDRDN